MINIFDPTIAINEIFNIVIVVTEVRFPLLCDFGSCGSYET